MVIHVVKPGDSIYSIARMYNVSPAKIIRDNELTNPNNLVVGQTIVVLDDNKRHVIKLGESLYMIARKYGVSIDDILSLNPEIKSQSLIYPGQVIRIPTKKHGTIEVNGYVLPNIDMAVLKKTLPHLTYIAIFSYEVQPDGSLKGINDEEIIKAAKEERVAPLMVITNLDESGGFSSDLARTILSNEDVQENLLNNIVSTLDSKGYSGLDIDFEFVYPEDREKYNNFLIKTVNKLRPLGYSVTTALAPKLSGDQKGLLYEAHDYPVHGKYADHVVPMTYEWGYTYSEPMAVAPVNEVRRVIDYAASVIPPEKILMGIPNYGYDWMLPYEQGRPARAISNTEAVDIARRNNAAIKYNERSQSPYFNYYDSDRQLHEVWFEDARSILAKMQVVKDYNLGGVSYWTLARYFPQNWLVLENLYDVRKVL
ncbi:LysM peptidoglycan-binding domain-containing protein [Alkalithermobacter paradoxus]|uniref:Spore germination protein YaaH n=1 Tax=Alkalithermobacter paradoxus TaxID=29349 RepID=A0A1V4I941_9FIRM|nr:spore germination protein YaaH [[Clostridium] thermoalcaliphilum]